jgi:hypothetical protein
MKLRNKKTGEITDLAKRGLLKSDNDNHIIVYPEGTLKYYVYDSLAELNEEWEDYTPAEPLIKDEKIRKAVRVWAEANEFGPNYKVKYYTYSLTSWQAAIEFNFDIKELEDGKEYTIAELCGEEEE